MDPGFKFRQPGSKTSSQESSSTQNKFAFVDENCQKYLTKPVSPRQTQESGGNMMNTNTTVDYKHGTDYNTLISDNVSQ